MTLQRLQDLSPCAYNFLILLLFLVPDFSPLLASPTPDLLDDHPIYNKILGRVVLKGYLRVVIDSEESETCLVDGVGSSDVLDFGYRLDHIGVASADSLDYRDHVTLVVAVGRLFPTESVVFVVGVHPVILVCVGTHVETHSRIEHRLEVLGQLPVLLHASLVFPVAGHRIVRHGNYEQSRLLGHC